MYRKEILYDKETRDYAMYLDGELVGFAHTYNEAFNYLEVIVLQIIHGAKFAKDKQHDA